MSTIQHRDIGNPDRIFADGIKLGDLRNMSFDEVIQAYEKRVTDWYFDVSKDVLNNTASNFMLTAWCCTIIDFLSQYRYGKQFSSASYFEDFFKEQLPKYDLSITFPIASVTNKNGKIYSKSISTIAEGFYHGFRCGLIHAGRILEYGRVNRENQRDAFVIQEWDDNGKKKAEIQLNPVILLQELEEVFKKYIAGLKHETLLQNNFKKKFYWEYGIRL